MGADKRSKSRRATTGNASLRTPASAALLVALVLCALVGFFFSARDLDAQPTQAAGRAEAVQSGLRLLIASHGRLMWYTPATNGVHILHEGGGVHYGVFPGLQLKGALKTVWFVHRPHNWHPIDTEEALVEVDLETGEEFSRKIVPSRFSHDAVRTGGEVYVCNTDQGEVLHLAYPTMDVLRRLRLFTHKDHVNTLSPINGKEEMWAMLHNLGQSDIVRVNLSMAANGQIIQRLRNVGRKAHGIVQLPNGQLLCLDSETAALIMVEPTTGAVTRLWTAPDQGRFLKGLAVVDDVAYFGVSKATSRQERDDPDRNSELAAFDLQQQQLLWRRELPTHGLLNVIAAPQLGDASTYRAMYTSGAGHPQARLGSESGSPASPFQQQQQQGDSTTTQPGSQSADVIPAAASGDHDEYQATPLKQAHAGSHVGDRGSDRQQASDGGASSTSHPGDSSTGHSSKSKKQAHGRVVSGSSSSSHDSVGLLSRKLGRDHSSSNSGSSSAGGQQVVNPSMQQGGDEGDVGGGSDLVDLAIDDEEVQAVSRKLRDAGFPAKVGGYWSTGRPFLDLTAKGGSSSWEAGIQLPLMRVDVSELKAKIQGLPAYMWDHTYQREHNAVVDGRDDNMNKFKPGVGAMYLVFSDRSTLHTYRFAYYEIFRDLVEPLVRKIVGEDGLGKVVRMQFALMPPGSNIRLHRDMGGYALKAHRIHIPLVTNKDIQFQVCPGLERRKHGIAGEITDDDASLPGDCAQLVMAEGMVFELNNRVLHRVYNKGNITRVQMVVDVAEQPRSPRTLKPGAACNYVRGTIVCPPEAVMPDPNDVSQAVQVHLS